MFYQIFFSPQVKQSAIISNKQGVSELPDKLLNDLRLWILGNKQKPGKISKLTRMINQCSALVPKRKVFYYQPKTTEKEKLNHCRMALFHMKTRVCLKYSLNDCSSLCNTSRPNVFVPGFFRLKCVEISEVIGILSELKHSIHNIRRQAIQVFTKLNHKKF